MGDELATGHDACKRVAQPSVDAGCCTPCSKPQPRHALTPVPLLLHAPPHPLQLDAFATIWRSEGLRGFYRGWAANSLKVIPQVGCGGRLGETMGVGAPRGMELQFVQHGCSC